MECLMHLSVSQKKIKQGAHYKMRQQTWTFLRRHHTRTTK